MRTYILGAGASVHAGYPLATQLWNVLSEWMEKHENPFFKNSKKKIESQFPDGSYDVEELFSKLSPECRRRLRYVICCFFNEIQQGSAYAYSIFANRHVQPADTIITFNYDVSLERELKRVGKWEVSDGYGFTIEAKGVSSSPVKLLKLHGSTNWIGEPLLNMTSTGPDTRVLGSRPAIPRNDLAFLGYDADETKDSLSRDTGTTLEMALILPILTKDYFINFGDELEWEGFFDALWQQAVETVRASEQIVILGYSFHPADERARDLLLEGNCIANVEVISWKDSERIAEEFRKCEYGFKDVHPLSIKFEKWAEN